MTQRTPLIVANWKLHGGIELICTSVASFIGKHFKSDIAICPPYIYIRDMLNFLQHSEVMVGSQNLSKYTSGAYTGETAARMIKEAGGSLCLVGHSERRQMFGESNASCQIKINQALECGLMPVYCIGENLQQREAGVMKDVLFKQLEETLKGVECSAEQICIAYEPVWAIGTGKAASPEDAQATHAYIREQLAIIKNSEFADKIRILYGGSVKKDNAAALMANPDIDGLLVGGASLDAEHFMQICMQAEHHAFNQSEKK